MTTIKAYSDLYQSKKLAEILPIESADMKWFFWKEEIDAPKTPTFGYNKTAAGSYKNTEAIYLPCWNLAALIDILPEGIDNNTDDFSQLEIYKNHVCYAYADGNVRIGIRKDNLVDACYEMIIRLHELNLL